jgi:hypothetical protein
VLRVAHGDSSLTGPVIVGFRPNLAVVGQQKQSVSHVNTNALAPDHDEVELTISCCGRCEPRMWQSGDDPRLVDSASPFSSVLGSRRLLVIALAAMDVVDSPMVPLQATVNWISFFNAIWEEGEGRPVKADGAMT